VRNSDCMCPQGPASGGTRGGDGVTGSRADGGARRLGAGAGRLGAGGTGTPGALRTGAGGGVGGRGRDGRCCGVFGSRGCNAYITVHKSTKEHVSDSTPFFVMARTFEERAQRRRQLTTAHRDGGGSGAEWWR
jgi:hypothetical protein